MTNNDLYDQHTIDHNNPHNRFMSHPILTDQIERDGLHVVWRELETVLRQNIPGAIAEFGCYAGTTSLFIRRQLDRCGQSGTREFHVYDSFQGLPEKGRQDSNAAGTDFTAGKLQVGKKQLIKNFQAASLQPPIIHAGWFNELQPRDIPEKIALAFLDGDFYDSIQNSLKLVWPRMSQGGVILVDDYQREALPGVEQAIKDFFAHAAPPSIRAEHNIAIIQLPKHA